MKIFVKFVLAMSVVTLMYGCAGSEGVASKPRDFSAYTDLAGALRSVGGLQITGTGNNIMITLRGQGSINLNTQPLYVVNNVPLGNNYSHANSVVNPAEITSIRILSGAQATTVWGEDGNHGVILIKTKNAGTK